jgi:hypothetical protein
MHLPKRTLRGDHCHCGTCDEYFNSTYAFDMHRVGDHGMPGSRRCLTVQEMRQRGMDKNATDWWISGSRLDSDLDYDSVSGALA